MEDVVWSATEIAASNGVPQATVSCSVRVMQKSASSTVQSTRISALYSMCNAKKAVF